MTDVREAPASNERTSSDAGQFIWYELMTPDPEAAGDFYSAVVPGWRFGEPIAADVDYRMIGRSDGGNAGGVLKLTHEMQQHGARPTWLGYLHVPDVDAAVREAEAKGGKTLMPAWDQPGVGRLAMIADPQGAPIYLMDPIPPEGDPNAKSDVFAPMAGERVNWNELATSDAEAALDFYRDLFGWGSNDAMDMGEQGKYRFIDHQGQRLGAIFRTTEPGHPRWRFYFGVPSIARAIEAVDTGGGRVTNGPHEVPGGGNIIIGIDPQGAEFALVGGK